MLRQIMLVDTKRIIAAFFCFVTIACTSYGQSSKPAIAFPTYQQIKGNQQEVFDEVPAPNSRVTTTAVSLSASAGYGLNVFDYPAGTVTYYLNDQPTTDIKYVKEVLNNKSISVETISVSQPNQDGKRTIRIRYEAL